MKLKLTRHFQDMMILRGINLDHVKKAIIDPDKEENTYENKIKVRKIINNREIEVIYCKEGFRDRSNEILVITAYYI